MGKPTRSSRASEKTSGATDTKPAKAKSAQAKPAQAKSAQAKSAGAKSAAAEPAGAKPAGAKPAGAKLGTAAAVSTNRKAASAANANPSATVVKPSAKSVVPPKMALAKLLRASAVKARTALAATSPAAPEAAQAVKHAINTTEKAKRVNAVLRPLPAALLARPTPRQVLAKVKSKAQALPKRGVRLYDLRENHCRWVLDRDGQEPAFCGAPRVGSSSWCAAHRKIVYPRAALQDGAGANGKSERPAG